MWFAYQFSFRLPCLIALCSAAEEELPCKWIFLDLFLVFCETASSPIRVFCIIFVSMLCQGFSSHRENTKAVSKNNRGKKVKISLKSIQTRKKSASKLENHLKRGQQQQSGVVYGLAETAILIRTHVPKYLCPDFVLPRSNERRKPARHLNWFEGINNERPDI